jgi:hypothetical protein
MAYLTEPREANLSAVSLGLGLLEQVPPGALGCHELIGVLPAELTQAGFQERQPLAVLVGAAGFIGVECLGLVLEEARPFLAGFFTVLTEVGVLPAGVVAGGPSEDLAAAGGLVGEGGGDGYSFEGRVD